MRLLTLVAPPLEVSHELSGSYYLAYSPLLLSFLFFCYPIDPRFRFSFLSIIHLLWKRNTGNSKVNPPRTPHPFSHTTHENFFFMDNCIHPLKNS